MRQGLDDLADHDRMRAEFAGLRQAAVEMGDRAGEGRSARALVHPDALGEAILMRRGRRGEGGCDFGLVFRQHVGGEDAILDPCDRR